MKTLFRLVVVVILALGAAAFWLRDSPYWTALEIQRGLDAKDVDRVEHVLAFERFSASATSVMGAVVADRLGVAGKDPGSKLLGGLLGVVVDGVGLAAAREGAQEMRRAIKEGRLERRLGPFVVNDGLAAFGDVATTNDGGTLELRGTCDGKAVSLVLLLEKHDGPLGGRPRRFVIVGVDVESGKAMAHLCAR